MPRPRKKVNLTWTELRQQRNALERFELYLPTLKLKQQQLQMTLREVWDLARSYPRGAVHLSLAPDTAQASVNSDLIYLEPPVQSRTDTDALDTARPYLEGADDLMVVAGL